ncbi:hypothetical protein [Novipirellula artificiosorum]|uniref:Uncharacterized protein n=1 Tax=Novipirellula artificiosorum TaxID=2528016 RepID=A0A5C6D6S8_9BACT|nr:hypothetical protein [Novipirellula artificiosorum]TWU32530.1 hypothetical protein Poly41_55080 [Novipirellula artificiosorum]
MTTIYAAAILLMLMQVCVADDTRPDTYGPSSDAIIAVAPKSLETGAVKVNARREECLMRMH